MTVVCTYRPPRSDPQTFCSQLEDGIKACDVTSRPFLLAGDMNAKSSQWLDSDTTDAAGSHLDCLLETYGLYQHVNFPTCIVRGVPKSCLDLVISNLDPDSLKITAAPPLSSADIARLSTGTCEATQHAPAIALIRDETSAGMGLVVGIIKGCCAEGGLG